MKYFIIFLLSFNFCLADKAKSPKYWRHEIRMPYTGTWPCDHRNHGDHKCTIDTNITIFLHPKEIMKEKRWVNWWKYQTCHFIDNNGLQKGCEKKADDCEWLQKQKSSIKKQWTLTSQKTTVELKIWRLPAVGSGFGWKLIDK